MIKKKIKELTEFLNKNKPDHKINIMEVCGTHTMAISRHGLRQLIPRNINLISGPGCPVCVTSTGDIDWIIEIARQYDASVFTFGDMFRVPGTETSLYNEKSKGRDIKICYSPADVLDFAKNNPKKRVIFIAIGFETTIPLTSIIIKRAYKEKINNFYIYNTHKLIPEALELLLMDKEIRIDAFLCPGHVSTIIGSGPYRKIAEKYNRPIVITGFEPIDVLYGIFLILRQIKERRNQVEIEYTRAVRPGGNLVAIKKMEEVFEICNSNWRGLGDIPKSGLRLKEKFENYDAGKKFNIRIEESLDILPGCICDKILKGLSYPTDCPFFGTRCTPENPIGACMVSAEGTCATYFKYSY